MKACVLHGIGDLRIEEVAKPLPGRGEVLLQVKASGICGSDIPRIFTKGTYHFPTIPGHEFAGLVVDVGVGVNKEYIGKRAAVFPLLPCMKCEYCRIGEFAQCRDYSYFGSRCDGGFAEYIPVPVWNLAIIPDGISYIEAAMAEPAAVSAHALRQAGIEIGDNVVIFGAGPIGIMLGQWARAWGADRVMLVDIDEGKVNFARENGFENVFDSNKDGDPVGWIYNLTNGRGADVAVEGAGVSITLEQSLKCTRPFGKIIAMGNPIGDITLSQNAYWELLRKQLKITGTWNSSYATLPKNDWTLALRAMQLGKLTVKSLVTHKVHLDEANDVLKMMRDKGEFFNKVMFVMDLKGDQYESGSINRAK